MNETIELLVSALGNDNSYLEALKKMDEAVWKKFASDSAEQHTIPNNLLEVLKDIADGIRGKEPEEIDDEEELKKLPKTLYQMLVSITNALNEDDDDFSAENFPEVEQRNFSKKINLLENITSFETGDTSKDKNIEDIATVKYFEDGNISGQMKFVKNFTDYSEDTEKQNGYYLPFKFVATDDIKSLELFFFEKENEPEIIKASEKNTDVIIFVNKSKEVAKRMVLIVKGFNAKGELVATKGFRLKNLNYSL